MSDYWEGFEEGMKSKQEEIYELRFLLSQWFETWNDGFNPDGDLLDDTAKILENKDE